jgi:hypothetical protein
MATAQNAEVMMSGQAVAHAKFDQVNIALQTQFFHQPDLVRADGLDA